MEEAPPVHLPSQEEGSAQPDLEQGVGVWRREVERRVLRAEGTAWADSGHSARGASFLTQVSAQMPPPQRGLLLPPREGACHPSSFLSSSLLGPSPRVSLLLICPAGFPGAGTRPSCLLLCPGVQHSSGRPADIGRRQAPAPCLTLLAREMSAVTTHPFLGCVRTH